MGILEWLSGNQIVVSRVDYNRILHSDMVDGFEIRRKTLGHVEISSRRLTVADPLVMPDLRPLTRELPNGAYALWLHSAVDPDGNEAIALAELRLREEAAIMYELALRPGEQSSQLSDRDDFFGFTVDSGLACIADTKTFEAYHAWQTAYEKDHPKAQIYNELLAEEFKKNALSPDEEGEWAVYEFAENQQLLMFAAGLGDGLYPVYYGVNKAIEVVNVVIDFQVILGQE